MANIVYGGLISGIRGSVGGVTFGQCHSGPTARQRPRPPVPGAVSQRTNQYLLVRAGAYWAALDVAIKAGWVAYSATVTYYDSLGRAYHPTGMNLFVGTALILMRVGADPSGLVAPGASGLAVPSAMTMWVAAGYLTIGTIVPWPITANHIIGSIYGADVRRVFNRARLVSQFGITTATAFPHVIASAVDTTWPSGAQLRMWVNWRQVDAYTRFSTLQRQAVDWVK